MKESEIRRLIHTAWTKRRKAIDELKKKTQAVEARCSKEIASVQAKCKHKNKSHHYGYEVSAYSTCDTCYKEFH